MNYTLKKLSPFGILVEAKDSRTHISEIDVERLRELFKEEQLILLRGFKTFSDPNSFADYCEKWGEVSLWPFGKVLELLEQEMPEDHIFDHSYVPLHWDGMYRLQVPEYQIFHCVKAPLANQGGRTTFSHTGLVLKTASREEKEMWEKVTGHYERKMEFYNSKTVSPIITRHPYRDFSVIRYNEPPKKENGNFINPPILQFLGLIENEKESFHKSLEKALYQTQNFYAHEWQDGDMVIADNFSLLHGREAFASKSPRHIQRVQVLSDPPFDNPGLESYQ